MTGSAPDVRPQLDLIFARRSGRTVLDRRLFRWPFVVTRTFALDRVPPHMVTVIVQTSSGAVHGDDHLIQRIHVGPNAAAHVTTQGAAAIHRAAAHRMTRDSVSLRVEDGGVLEYWPQPRILFPEAALEQTMTIDCAAEGTALVADAFTTHDPEARGRCFRQYASTTILRRGEADPVLVDRMDLRQPLRGRSARFQAFGSVLVVMPEQAKGVEVWADALSATFAAMPGLYGAASRLPGEARGIGVRLAGLTLREVRVGMDMVWTRVRQELYGVSPAGRRMEPDIGLPG